MGKRQSTEARRERNRALKFRLRIYSRDRGLCVYCGEAVIFLSQVPYGRRIRVERYWIEIHGRGGVQRMLLATLDHVRRITDGGKSTYHNLALACIQCNCRRNDEVETEQLEAGLCQRCGYPGASIDDPYCDVCRRWRIVEGFAVQFSTDPSRRRPQGWRKRQLRRATLAKMGGFGPNGGA